MRSTCSRNKSLVRITIFTISSPGRHLGGSRQHAVMESRVSDGKIQRVISCLFVSDSGQLEKQLEDVSLARRDLEDSSRHVKTLEKQMKAITQERDELHKVI